jgi:2-iminobutanoate/2-iminopropanoate deaminase
VRRGRDKERGWCRVTTISAGQVTTSGALIPKASFSQAFWAGDLLFTAGLGPHDPTTAEPRGATVEEQTRATLESIEAVLAAAGLTLSDVVKVNAHLQDFQRDFRGFESVYREKFSPPYPARITVGSTLPGILVEIDVVARARPS